MDWNLAITVAVGVMAGVTTVVLLILAVVWALDRIDKWREARKNERVQTERRTIAELTHLNRELNRQLQAVEAERARLEAMSRDLMLHDSRYRAPEKEEESAVVRTRYERMLASE